MRAPGWRGAYRMPSGMRPAQRQVIHVILVQESCAKALLVSWDEG